MLQDRGVECKGCSEKEDYVKLAFESQSPTSPADRATTNSRASDAAGGDKIDKEKLDEVVFATVATMYRYRYTVDAYARLFLAIRCAGVILRF